MARRDVSSPSRIFSRKRPAWARLLGPVLLGLCLLVTGWGLTTAIYLERAPLAGRSTATAESAQTAPVATPPAPPSPAAAAPTLAEIEPAAGSTASSPETPPQQAQQAQDSAPLPPSGEERVAALPPSAALAVQSQPTAPERIGTGHSYWVEYGVFAQMGPAKRLRHALADHGVTARIVKTHTPQGRLLFRVRSGPLAEEAAHQAMRQSEAAFGITALLHRGAPGFAASRYWVQFGAFQHRAFALRLKSHLDQKGVATIVLSTRGSNDKLLYLVRSRLLPDRASAIALGERGERVSDAAYLVGLAHGAALTRSSPHPAHPRRTASAQHA